VLLLLTAPALSAGTNEFTVATWNILYRNPNLAALMPTLRAVDADLVALQETNPESERHLRQTLTATYAHMRFIGGKRSDGFGFLSKTPLRTLRFVDGLPEWRGTWVAEVELGGRSVQVVSVHLATPKARQMTSMTGMLRTFQEADETHALEMRRLEPFLKTGPTLVLGDFNSLSVSYPATFLRQRGFVDSFASVTEHADRQGTWVTRQGEQSWPFRIDFIYHDAALATVRSRIVASDASDHRLVVSSLRWVKP